MTVGGGTGITLLTGLITRPENLGVTNYGFPFAWLNETMDHLINSTIRWQVNVLNLIADIIVWAVIDIALFVESKGFRAAKVKQGTLS